jgi:hypothetical protein
MQLRPCLDTIFLVLEKYYSFENNWVLENNDAIGCNKS